jgi:hypothetical protein
MSYFRTTYAARPSVVGEYLESDLEENQYVPSCCLRQEFNSKPHLVEPISDKIREGAQPLQPQEATTTRGKGFLVFSLPLRHAFLQQAIHHRYQYIAQWASRLTPSRQ